MITTITAYKNITRIATAESYEDFVQAYDASKHVYIPQGINSYGLPLEPGGVYRYQGIWWRGMHSSYQDGIWSAELCAFAPVFTGFSNMISQQTTTIGSFTATAFLSLFNEYYISLIKTDKSFAFKQTFGEWQSALRIAAVNGCITIQPREG